MNNKRKAIKKLVGGSAVIALAPSSWTKPIVSSVVLPAHAQTSEQFPTFTQRVYESGVRVTDATNAFQNIINLNAISSPGYSTGLIYFSIDFEKSVFPDQLEKTLWESAVIIESGVLKIVGLRDANPNIEGLVSIEVRTIDGKFYGESATINFDFSNRL